MPLTRSEAAATGPIQAGGAVLWRPGADGPELALIHRPRYDDWSFPKGKLDAGEHIQHAAQREVLEETGYRTILGRRLPTVSYEVNGVPKRVRYWAGRAVPEHDRDHDPDHEHAGDDPFTPNAEVDRLAWLTPTEARLRLSRALDTAVLDAFMAAPVETIPIILLRHGAAERRSAQHWPDDRLRPLTPLGRAQAERLVPLLTAYGPLEIRASPAVRCLDTVRPYAGSRRIVIDVDPALSESAHEESPRATAAWIRALIAEGRPVLASTHRPVLNTLIAAAIAAPDSPDGPRINGRPWTRREAERLHSRELATGSAWVLHVTPRPDPTSAPRLVAADLLRP